MSFRYVHGLTVVVHTLCHHSDCKYNHKLNISPPPNCKKMLTIHLLTKREGGIVTIQRKTSIIKNAETLRRREAFHPTGGVLRAQSFGRLCITQERMRVCHN